MEAKFQILAQYFFRRMVFLHAFVLSLAYTATQDARGQKAGFFFFTVPAQLIPVCMLGATLLMSGSLEEVFFQATGLIAAHLYDFLTRLYPEFGGGRQWISTPAFLSRVVQTPRVLQRGYGTAVRGNQSSSGSSTGAQGSGPLPDSWKTRGTGHRLG